MSLLRDLWSFAVDFAKERSRRWAAKGNAKPVIIPTVYGGLYLLLVVAAFVQGYYRHNGACHGVGLMLTVFGIVAMIQTNYTVAGMTMIVRDAPPAEEGRPLTLHVQVAKAASNMARRLAGEVRFNLKIDAPPQLNTVHPGVIGSLGADQVAMVTVTVAAQSLGVHPLQHLRLSTRGMYGLFHAWIWVPTPTELLWYPRSEGMMALPARGDGGTSTGRLGEEFSGHHPYLPGDSLGKVDWRAFARGRPLMVKNFAGGADTQVDLSLEQVQQLGFERGLRQLSAWIRLCAQDGRCFSLSIGRKKLVAARGARQARAAWELLARVSGEAP